MALFCGLLRVLCCLYRRECDEPRRPACKSVPNVFMTTSPLPHCIQQTMKEPFPVWCGISAFSLTLIGWGWRTRVYFISNFITFDPQSITVLLVAGLLRHYSCTIEHTLWWCTSHWILIHSQNHVAITALWFKNIFLCYPFVIVTQIPSPLTPHLAAILLSVSKNCFFKDI